MKTKNPVGRPSFSSESATEDINIRVTKSKKDRFKKAAKDGGKTLSAWMTAAAEKSIQPS